MYKFNKIAYIIDPSIPGRDLTNDEANELADQYDLTKTKFKKLLTERGLYTYVTESKPPTDEVNDGN